MLWPRLSCLWMSVLGSDSEAKRERRDDVNICGKTDGPKICSFRDFSHNVHVNVSSKSNQLHARVL